MCIPIGMSQSIWERLFHEGQPLHSAAKRIAYKNKKGLAKLQRHTGENTDDFMQGITLVAIEEAKDFVPRPGPTSLKVQYVKHLTVIMNRRAHNYIRDRLTGRRCPERFPCSIEVALNDDDRMHNFEWEVSKSFKNRVHFRKVPSSRVRSNRKKRGKSAIGAAQAHDPLYSVEFA